MQNKTKDKLKAGEIVIDPLIRRGYRYLTIPLTGFIVQSAKKFVEQARSSG